MQWNKCAEGLPKDGAVCWVYVKLRQIEICVYNEQEKCWDDEDDDDFQYPLTDVTHWMPFVTPPPPRD